MERDACREKVGAERSDIRRKAGRRKRTAIVLCALVLALGLTACGQTGQNKQTGQGNQSEQSTQNQQTDQGSQSEQNPQNDQNAATEPAAEETIGIGQASAADSARNTISLRLTTEDGTVIEYALNDSQAAAGLYSQLPLTIEVEDYSTNEKIFYPPEELDTGDAPEAAGGAGVLAYYEPWGDMVLFYDDFGTASGLYELGTVTSGSENISELSGSVRIEQAEEAE